MIFKSNSNLPASVDNINLIRIGKTETPLPKDWKPQKKIRDVILGFRPQDTKLQNDDELETRDLKIPVTVRSLQPLGHDVLIDLSAKDHARTLVAQTSWKKNTASVGSEILARINLIGLHFFDAETKKRINF